MKRRTRAVLLLVLVAGVIVSAHFYQTSRKSPFLVTVTADELAANVRQRDVPLCKKTMRFVGEWPARRASAESKLTIAARHGVCWNGFYLGYELTAKVPTRLYGQTHLSLKDLTDVNIRYTDDQLEAGSRGNAPVEELIASLRRKENRVPENYTAVIPGGEMLEFSGPLKALMFRGKDARKALLAHLDDPEIRNEVVVALGAVGNEATVPELISRYPRDPVKEDDRAAKLTRVCFSYALSWLTGAQIDRSRWGTSFSPDNAEKWQKWWTENRATFRVPSERPRATWVPSYPVLDSAHMAEVKTMFAERDWSIDWPSQDWVLESMRKEVGK
jgi:hypothetical protein